MGRLPKSRLENDMPEIQKLQDQHHEMVRLMALGKGNQEVAQMMGYTPQMCSIVRNSTVAREKLDNLHEQKDKAVVGVTKKLAQYSEEALDVMYHIMHGPMTPENVKVTVAKDFLDRAGHGAVKRMSVGIGILTPERITEIKERARMAAQEDVIEIETVEEMVEDNQATN